MPKPHLSFGTFGRKPTLFTMAAACPMSDTDPTKLVGKTPFSKLSQQSQDLIVSAALGESIDATIPEPVKQEIAQWCSEPDQATHE